MKVAILDDYFDTLRRLPSFARLDGLDVSVWTDHVDDVGELVARYAEAFGMNVQWWGSEEGRTRASRDQVVIASSRQAFFAESDIVSIHVRLRPSTRA